MKRSLINYISVTAIIVTLLVVIGFLMAHINKVEMQRNILADIIHCEKDFQEENWDCNVRFNIYNTAQPFLEEMDMDTTQLNWSYCY